MTRAVCRVEGERLARIVETDGCERRPDGTLVANGTVVPEDTVASMNVWCFDPSVMTDFVQQWEEFLEHNHDDAKAECQLPTVVGQLVADERLQVVVRTSPEAWIGLTNPQDLEVARQVLADR